jgi:pentatricopeptide repeat protein
MRKAQRRANNPDQATMKKQEIIKLGKQLLQQLADFQLAGKMLLMPPIRPVLRGIVFDYSAFNKTSFTVTAFVLPLCVPTTHLYLNFGNRIRNTGGNDRWDVAEHDLPTRLGSALKVQAVPFLSSVSSLLDFVGLARTFSQSNPNTLRAIAYSLARDGRIDESLEMLDQMLSELDENVSWQVELAAESTKLREMLKARPMEALRQLQAWECQTENNLGLAEIFGPPASQEGQPAHRPGRRRQ